MTSHRSLSCVIVQPDTGLLPWQRVCVDRLIDDLDVAVTGCVSCAVLADSNNVQHLFARWLDNITLPKFARTRRISPRVDTAAQRIITANDVNSGQFPSRADREWIRACKPEFVLVFDCSHLFSNETALAPYGLWHFSEGHAALPSREARPGIDALARGETRLSLSLLAQSNPESQPSPIACGYTPAVSNSRKRSLARLYEIAPELLRHGIRNLRSCNISPEPSAPKYTEQQSPAGWSRFLRTMLCATARRCYQKLWLSQRWEIGLLKERTPIPDAQDVQTAHWITGPKAGFWADPCFLADASTTTVLVEEYRDDTSRGEITKLSWHRNDLVRSPTTQTVLCLDKHLSFPRSYTHAGERWLIPEMAACGRQYAYRLDNNGDRTNTKPVTVEGLSGIDPVLFTHNGRYWAFISPSGRRANYQLDLYVADDFLGPYRIHPASPVCIDPHGGRSAGPVIRDRQRLLRFGQVFGHHYGEAIDVFEIITITDTSYAERRVGRIQADDKAMGTHTIDFAANMTIIDRFRLVPIWRLAAAQWTMRRAK